MGTQAQPAPEKTTSCIARQPILAADESVIGYEVLFRDSAEERHFTAGADSATRAAINTLNLIGLGVLCDGRPASGKSGAKTALSPGYDLMVAREIGNWEVVTSLGKQLNLSLNTISQTYNEAMRWAHQITNADRAGETAAKR